MKKKASKTGLSSPRNYYMLVCRELIGGELVETAEHGIIMDLDNWKTFYSKQSI
ncbi:MAG: hypothetical protein J7L38_06380 [Thermoproteales archaeon]|nr:hypothetical protein [Thermoproteales archaeon]